MQKDTRDRAGLLISTTRKHPATQGDAEEMKRKWTPRKTKGVKGGERCKWRRTERRTEHDWGDASWCNAKVCHHRGAFSHQSPQHTVLHSMHLTWLVVVSLFNSGSAFKTLCDVCTFCHYHLLGLRLPLHETDLNLSLKSEFFDLLIGK